MANFERRQQQQQQQANGLYTIQHQPFSSHVMFPMPGRESADRLRDALRRHLPLPYITDEEGEIKPIASISNDHLPKLQAKVWRDIPRYHTASLSVPVYLSGLSEGVGPIIRGSTAQQRVSEADLLLARHVKSIADRLASGYVFILRTVPKPCSYSLKCCKQSSCLASTPPKEVITLEPFLHWGTVSPARELLDFGGHILLFRRNGEKMDDPLWTSAVRDLTPVESPAYYCSECLAYLMCMRVKAWAILDRDGDRDRTTISPIQRPVASAVGGHVADNNGGSGGDDEVSPPPNESDDGVRVKSLQPDCTTGLGSSALLSDSIPDFTATGLTTTRSNPSRQVNTNAVIRFFSANKARREAMARSEDNDD